MKSTVAQIKARFDADVERFASLEIGHTAIMDSVLMLDLMTRAAAASTPWAVKLLDIGCGAGNYSLKQLALLPKLSITLADLSMPMLERAEQRVRSAGCTEVSTVQGDIREVDLGDERSDIILAGAVLHHLREEEEWRQTFTKCYKALRPGGGFWIADLITHDDPAVQDLMWGVYGQYLVDHFGKQKRDTLFGFIEQEDTPRSLPFQLNLLREVGFAKIEVLHKNACFAAFGGIKAF